MKNIFLIISLLSITVISAQSLWKKIDSKKYSSRSKIARKNIPSKYDLYSLDINNLKAKLSQKSNQKKIIKIPNVNGGISNFYVNKTSNFTRPLAKKYGYIKSFNLIGINDKTASGKISIGSDGVFITIHSGKHSSFYIDPYTKKRSTFIAYERKNLENNNLNNRCLVTEKNHPKKYQERTQKRAANDSTLRTFRLALVCTGEYADYHINNQGVSSGTIAAKKTAVLSAMNTTITRVNEIYERDLAVHLNIVVNNTGENPLIFLGSSTDGLSNGTPGDLINQSQSKCDNILGASNYDVGHTFSTGGGGLAGVGVICRSGQKARGVTGTSAPIDDAYDIDFVCHELGHQFGAPHTFNGTGGNCSSGTRSSLNAVEPGSGSTIMAYAGICDPVNIQRNTDAYFHAVSIASIYKVLDNATCPVETNTNNAAPVVDAGEDVSVPKSTPLVLRGKANDSDTEIGLTYCWEQLDNEISVQPPIPTSLVGPTFRSLKPTTNSDRYLPKLATIIIGSTATEWEVLPKVGRELNFSLLVRDNHSGGGASGRDDLKITVTNADPFIVTSQNTNVTLNGGTTETITWNKSTSDIAPINCANVRIKLSTDGGITFPIILTNSTPNDGSFEFIVPNNPTIMARIMVEAIDNIFYNVNTSNFTIKASTIAPIYTISDETGSQSICSIEKNKVEYAFKFNTFNSFSENVTFSLENLPIGATSSFSQASISTEGTFLVTISNLESVAKGMYTIKLNTSSISDSQNKTISFVLGVNNGLCKTESLNGTLCISEGTMNSQISTKFVKFSGIDKEFYSKTSGYNDFTSISTDVERGSTHELTVEAAADGQSGVKTFAWIDWNQNGIFETNESYELGDVFGNYTTNRKSIIIPNTARVGSTTLRIITRALDQNTNNGSCLTGFDGETQDYTINVKRSATYTITNETGVRSICNNITNTVVYTFKFKTLDSFSENITFSLSNLPLGATSSFSPKSISTSGSFSVTISNLEDVDKGTYTVKLNTTYNSKINSLEFVLGVNAGVCKTESVVGNLCISQGTMNSKISTTSVKFIDIDKTGEVKTSGYNDFTAISTKVKRGATHMLTVKAKSDGQGGVKIYAWIDWNQNNEFESNEFFDLGDVVDSSENTKSITIPKNAVLGSTKLRITTAVINSKEINSSCLKGFNGETEDYSVIIEDIPYALEGDLFDDLKVYPIPSNLDGKITVVFKVKDSKSTLVKVFDLTGRLIHEELFSNTSNLFNKEINLSKLSSTIYILYIENAGKSTSRQIFIK